MLYNIRQYKAIFNAPKREQELIIVSKIILLLNKKKYIDIDDLILKNSDYNLFLNNNNFQNVVKHCNDTLNNDDFIQIISNLRVQIKSLGNNTVQLQDINNEQNSSNNISNEMSYQKQLVLSSGQGKIYSDRKEESYEY